MSWDQVEGNWKAFKGKLREQWGDLTDDELEQLKGKRDQLVGKIQEKYGNEKAQIERELDELAAKI